MTQPTSNPKDIIGRTKPPLGLIPGAAMVQEAMVLKLGAEKYGKANWRQETISASVYIDATLRHLFAWLDGESADPESNQSHLAHARACLGIMLDAQAIGKMQDDRPVQGGTPALLEKNKGGKGR